MIKFHLHLDQTHVQFTHKKIKSISDIDTLMMMAKFAFSVLKQE